MPAHDFTASFFYLCSENLRFFMLWANLYATLKGRCNRLPLIYTTTAPSGVSPSSSSIQTLTDWSSTENSP